MKVSASIPTPRSHCQSVTEKTHRSPNPLPMLHPRCINVWTLQGCLCCWQWMQHFHWVSICCLNLNLCVAVVSEMRLKHLAPLVCILLYPVMGLVIKTTEIVQMMSSSVGWISFMWHMKSGTWRWIYSAAHKHMLICTIMQERSQLFPGNRWWNTQRDWGWRWQGSHCKIIFIIKL